jgi:hypothetical protein
MITMRARERRKKREGDLEKRIGRTLNDGIGLRHAVRWQPKEKKGEEEGERTASKFAE